MPTVHLSIPDEMFLPILEAAVSAKVKPQEVIRRIIEDHTKLKQRLADIDENYALVPFKEYEAYIASPQKPQGAR